MAANENDTFPSSSVDGNASSCEEIDVLEDLKDIGAPIKQSAEKALEEQTGLGADRMKVFADAINGAASSLEQEMPQIASYVRDAGAWVEQSAENVRHQRFDALLETAGTFARNNPASAFGIAAVTGFALSRFLKSERPAVNVSSSSGHH